MNDVGVFPVAVGKSFAGEGPKLLDDIKRAWRWREVGGRYQLLRRRPGMMGLRRTVLSPLNETRGTTTMSTLIEPKCRRVSCRSVHFKNSNIFEPQGKKTISYGPTGSDCPDRGAGAGPPPR